MQQLHFISVFQTMVFWTELCTSTASVLQTPDGPLLFSKESVTLTCSQGYCLINTEPPA